MDKIKLVISDCHLSAGKFFEGRLNPHEDFKFDDEMVDFLDYFSTSFYDESAEGPVDVELFLNGDFLDFLNVPYFGEFEDAITEQISLHKLEAIIAGHSKVMAALKRFAAKPNKRITYMIGNHDADLFFPKVRERIIREWDPEAKFPSDKIEIIADRDRIRIEGGVEIRHGNQFEAVHVLDFEKPLLEPYLDEPLLNLPWGSVYVLKIVNRLKWEREFLDKVRPVKIFVFFGLLFDPWFTIRYVFLSAFYFLKTRFTYSRKRHASFKTTAEILKQETALFLDLEKQARTILDTQTGVQTVIMGHVHKPIYKIYPDGKQYINTGTWTKMINLDWTSLGQQYLLTFALIRVSGEQARCELRQWVGEQSPHRGFHH
ncbi:MAG: hypothetical protein A2428_10365 [Bdellovibrionales bacterium RIFOXYC1_FULL_54_43]|nr:MAG: hypothetical protein A2428_10365 [Bdellovibrionales bacterium RIFOXYC1_FULL_54_43]OFZ80388.1 MAG: hypothetical protein A2603_13490 [Bdellovibrionales bacterium RIFOXYD1_FULL_55_31]